jgi:hypothetical protein
MRPGIVVACIGIVACSACHSSKMPMSQLQIRQMQTRSYEIQDTKRAIKAVLNVLQDEAFIPRQASLELGFIHAVREVDVTRGNERFWAQFWDGKNARYRKNSIIDCAANVTEIANGIRLRVNFQVKILNNKGECLSVQAIEDPLYYQNFLQKVDKGIYYEKQGV